MEIIWWVYVCHELWRYAFCCGEGWSFTQDPFELTTRLWTSSAGPWNHLADLSAPIRGALARGLRPCVRGSFVKDEKYHSRHWRMKETKESSAFSRARARDLDAGGARFSLGLSTLLWSKNTCHLFEFYLRYLQMYRKHVLGRKTQHLDDQTHLLMLILSSEERKTEV